MSARRVDATFPRARATGLCVAGAASISCFAARLTWAAELAGGGAKYGTAVTDLGFPSVSRVVVGFLITVALAVGIAVGLRRFWPMLLRQKGSSTRIHSAERTAVSPTLTVHVIDVEGTRVVVAEGRSGVALMALPPVLKRDADAS